MSAAVVDFVEELVTQPRRQHAFRRSAEAYVADSALGTAEREAVVSGDVGRIRGLLSEHSPVREEPSALIVILGFEPDGKGASAS
ncbi:hypothetical protein SSP35_02_05400 [Streptomyces sp. NBRC 110611]|uniref:hypothetical protein n=1 Tax=Streptomyces sp. NBRC 110611 TaxID=1621259 RepID=UPI0008311D1E|nr:hypothetical protein [Streptomyces sp. NBRC 110611]GAU66171.1 hypothetical protein SSP35_02_05400 [Streptomyces sp. NBRC 110611]